MARVFVTEKIAEPGLDLLRDNGHEVIIQEKLSPEALIDAIADMDALIIRSATKVTDEVLAAANALKVVGRAGVGIDNVDVAAATARGVMVVNAPESNIVSAAEQAFALLISTARNIPQAHGDLKQGQWNRSKWEGVELYQKTLGIIGLGRVGSLLARRAQAFGMTVIAYDPFVSQEKAKQMQVELVDELDDLMRRADFVSVHLQKTPETMNLINADRLAKAKPTMRLINTARGGIINEEDLANALQQGVIAGAGIDVFATEPTTDSPLFACENIVVTPHLGASTAEAQDRAGITIAEQVVLALNNDFVPFAVNIAAREADEEVRPYISVAETLGRFVASLNDGVPATVTVDYEGEIADHDTAILGLSVLKGLFAVEANNVTYVNANTLADERGLELVQTRQTSTSDYVSQIRVTAGAHSVAAAVLGDPASAQITSVDGYSFQIPPAPHLLLVRNDDRPGVIGVIGTVTGEAGVNIDDMRVSRSEAKPNEAMMLLSTSGEANTSVLEKLQSAPGILEARRIELG